MTKGAAKCSDDAAARSRGSEQLLAADTESEPDPAGFFNSGAHWFDRRST